MSTCPRLVPRLVEHLFARCERPSHPDATALLRLYRQLLAALCHGPGAAPEAGSEPGSVPALLLHERSLPASVLRKYASRVCQDTYLASVPRRLHILPLSAHAATAAPQSH